MATASERLAAPIFAKIALRWSFTLSALPNVAVEGGTIDWSCFPEANAVAGAGNISDDPMFVDAEGELSGASPARDAVDVANLVADDLLGNVRPAWAAVVLRFAVDKKLGGGIVVDNSLAVLSGVTLTGTVGGNDDNRTIGCGITLIDGVVTNCHLTGCNSTSNRSQVPLSVAGGLAVDCQIFANTNGATAWKPLCMGVCVSGGVLLRTRIVDNSSPNVEGGDAGAGLRMTGGEVRDCLIAGNSAFADAGIPDPPAPTFRCNVRMILGKDNIEPSWNGQGLVDMVALIR